MQTEKEKSPEIFTLLWETFNLSQGNPDLQKLMFEWISAHNLLPKKIPDTIPRTIFDDFGPPGQHVNSGRHNEIDWENAKKIVEKYREKLDQKLAILIDRFMENDVYDPEQLKEIETCFKEKISKIPKDSEEVELLRKLGTDAFRKKEVIKMWQGLVEAKNKPSNSKNKLAEEILDGMIARDKKYLSPLDFDELEYKTEGRPRRGRSLKPDDQYDSFASYIRIYILKKNKETHSLGVSRLINELHTLVHSPNLSDNFFQKINEVAKLWENRHPRQKFFSEV